MNRFRVQENVPDPYITHSRDFQMLCNLFDLMNNGVKFDIDTIKSLSESIRCPESLIKYLQHKLGFFSDVKMSDDTLRTILKCFPYIVRHKGSKRGVRESIFLFLSVVHSDGKSIIEYKDFETHNDPNGNYIVILNIEDKALDVTILTEILRYILPTGYIVEYSFFQSADIKPTITEVSDRIKITFVDEAISSGVKLSVAEDSTLYEDNVLSGISNTTIIKVQNNEDGVMSDTAPQSINETMFIESNNMSRKDVKES